MVRVIRPVAVVVFWKREITMNPNKNWIQLLPLRLQMIATSSPTVWITSTLTGIDSTEYTYIQPPPPVVDVDDDSVLTSSSTDNISTTEYTVEPMVDIDDDDTDDLVVVPSTDTDGRPMQPIV
mmetsp:Transcript_3143/g.3470  ORF Transcript_3143/g.3470 Transcript_3143/m.3470 type:complete len:123 (+) Transcript_3143:440-808(+)